MLKTILTKTLEAGLNTLIDAGFGEEVRDLKARVFGQDAQSKRERAFNLAFEAALQTLPEHALLDDPAFQEEVVNALLDPQSGFNPQAAAQKFIQTNPQQTRHIKRFFNTLEGHLLADEYWGELLTRYQEVRFREDVLEILAKRGLPTDERPVIQDLLATEGSALTVGGGDAVAAGGILIKGGVGGNVTIHHAPDPRALEAEKMDTARRRYLESLAHDCQFLPLVDLGRDPDTDKDVTLNDVYIDLNTTALVSPDEKGINDRQRISPESPIAWSHSFGEDRPFTALEAVVQTSRLVLLGDPGSGKSTFARHLLAWQAGRELGQPTAPPGIKPGLLPILITLRDLVPRLNQVDFEALSKQAQESAYLKVIRTQLQADLERLDAASFAEGVFTALRAGTCLLVLDGLDEVPQSLQGHLRATVLALCQHFAPQNILLTCRVRSYVGEAEQPGFNSYTLAPFTPDQIHAFIQQWYQAQARLGRVTPQEAHTKTEDLAQAAQEEHLAELATNPMMLTSMIIVHQQNYALPPERVRLYRLVVEVLLKRWQRQKVGGELTSNVALNTLFKDDLRLRQLMERLAFEAHLSKKKKEVADLSRLKALEILEKKAYVGDLSLAQAFLDYVDMRAGLLVGRGGEPGHPTSYSFPHRTFQEYLAGCYLSSHPQAANILFELASEPEYWTVAVELGAEQLFHNTGSGGPHNLRRLSKELFPFTGIVSQNDLRRGLWAIKMAVLLGKDEVQNDPLQDGTRLLKLYQGALIELLSSDLTPPERADAGRALASLGDSRREVMERDAMQFCFIPEGNFSMGDQDEAHEVTLPAYWMARFPVTNAQFAEFVTAGGYEQQRYWEEAEQAGVWKQGKIKGRWDDAPRGGPEFFREPFHLPNHPVVGVTWYEGLAYTRWLTERWHAQGWLAHGWQVHLPSEAEWEKAARGGHQIPTVPLRTLLRPVSEGLPAFFDLSLADNPLLVRAYPWGEEFNANATNTTESRIETTSAVGCFPEGVSPYGVEEMSGNVCEWTRSIYKAYPYGPHDGREDLTDKEDGRVLRGGAFVNNGDDARCSFRGDSPFGLPVVRLDGVGFRLVVSPSS